MTTSAQGILNAVAWTDVEMIPGISKSNRYNCFIHENPLVGIYINCKIQITVLTLKEPTGYVYCYCRLVF